MPELIMAVLECIMGDLVLALIYLVVWAILVPCSLIVATPLVLVLALIRPGGFRENCKRYYGAILRHLAGMVKWARTKKTQRASRSS